MRKLILLMVVSGLSACQAPTPLPDDYSEAKKDPLYTLLADAKIDVDDAYRILAETKNAMATQMLSEQERQLAYERATQIPPGFEKTVTLENWVGPLNALAYQIGFWTNYKVEIFRDPVDMPIVRINQVDSSVFDIYQQIRIQVGDKAIISAEGNVLKIVYPELGG